MATNEYDRSLDDIIKSNKKGGKNNNSPNNKTKNQPNSPKKQQQQQQQQQATNKSSPQKNGRKFKLNRNGMYSSQMVDASPKKGQGQRQPFRHQPIAANVSKQPQQRQQLQQQRRRQQQQPGRPVLPAKAKASLTAATRRNQSQVALQTKRRAAALKRNAMLRLNNAGRRKNQGGSVKDARDQLLAKRRKIQILKTLLSLEKEQSVGRGAARGAGRGKGVTAAGRGRGAGARGALRGRIGGNMLQGRFGGRLGLAAGVVNAPAAAKRGPLAGRLGVRPTAGQQQRVVGAGLSKNLQQRLGFGKTAGGNVARGGLQQRTQQSKTNNNKAAAAKGVVSRFQKLNRDFGFRSDDVLKQQQQQSQQKRQNQQLQRRGLAPASKPQVAREPQPQQQQPFRGRLQGRQPIGGLRSRGATGAGGGGGIGGGASVAVAAAAAGKMASDDILTVKIENDKMRALTEKGEKNRAKRERQKMNKYMIDEISNTPMDVLQARIPPGYALVRRDELLPTNSAATTNGLSSSSSFPSYQDYVALTAAARQSAATGTAAAAAPTLPVSVGVTRPASAATAAAPKKRGGAAGGGGGGASRVKDETVVGIDLDPGVFRNIGTGKGLSLRFHGDGDKGGNRTIFM